MNKQEKQAFVTGLCENIVREVNEAIADGRIPEEWDGHELRCLLADRFEQSASMSILRREKRSKRARDYRNHLLITPGL